MLAFAFDLKGMLKLRALYISPTHVHQHMLMLKCSHLHEKPATRDSKV